ncbi:MAG TPA: hypothetical protein VIL95_00195 [Bacillota bacterium]
MKRLPGWTGRVVRIAVTAAAVTLALLVLTNLYTRTTFSAPLSADIARLPYVEQVWIEEGNPPRVTVLLGEVEHLREAYGAIEPLIRAHYGDGRVALQLEDRRTPELVRAFYRLRPLVLEAVARGNYTEMSARFGADAQRLGLSPQSAFTVDDRFVYIQLHRGTSYLYAVEPLPARAEAPGAAPEAMQP